jgi:pimeloyl-ACP methyl ester carboxylesterase
VTEPQDRFFESDRLQLHFVVHGDESKPPLLLIHGGNDHARSWDFVAAMLTDRYAVYAPDLRGHGDSDWQSGGAYLMSSYIADLARLIEAIGRGPVQIVGHSLGGCISLEYAISFPERVSKLASIEGLHSVSHFDRPGLPQSEQTRLYVEQIAEFSRREPRRYPSLEAAQRRMSEGNHRLTPQMARHLTQHAVRRQDDGSYVWKYDNNVRMMRPLSPTLADAKLLWQSLRTPTLIVSGSEGYWSKLSYRDEMLGAVPGARIVTVEGAGHWVHHDRFDEFVTLVRDFFDE